jgi:hypothetical protein
MRVMIVEDLRQGESDVSRGLKASKTDFSRRLKARGE